VGLLVVGIFGELFCTCSVDDLAEVGVFASWRWGVLSLSCAMLVDYRADIGSLWAGFAYRESGSFYHFLLLVAWLGLRWWVEGRGVKREQ